MDGEILPATRSQLPGRTPVREQAEPVRVTHEVLDVDPDSRPMAPQVTHLPPSSPIFTVDGPGLGLPPGVVARRLWTAHLHETEALVPQEPDRRPTVRVRTRDPLTPDQARQLAADLLDAADWATDRWRQELSR